METIFDIEITDEDLRNENYNFQSKLTPRLDEITTDFNQEIINQIVLWKVNRYSEIDKNVLRILNQIKNEDTIFDKKLTRQVLEGLLEIKGIRLPMASTILRFKNPKIFQIIDQRVYRFIMGENLPTYFGTVDNQINLYFEYLKKLKSVCEEMQINFQLSDRIIYELDKKHNKDLKIKH